MAAAIQRLFQKKGGKERERERERERKAAQERAQEEREQQLAQAQERGRQQAQGVEQEQAHDDDQEQAHDDDQDEHEQDATLGRAAGRRGFSAALALTSAPASALPPPPPPPPPPPQASTPARPRPPSRPLSEAFPSPAGASAGHGQGHGGYASSASSSASDGVAHPRSRDASGESALSGGSGSALSSVTGTDGWPSPAHAHAHSLSPARSLGSPSRAHDYAQAHASGSGSPVLSSSRAGSPGRSRAGSVTLVLAASSASASAGRDGGGGWDGGGGGAQMERAHSAGTIGPRDFVFGMSSGAGAGAGTGAGTGTGPGAGAGAGGPAWGRSASASGAGSHAHLPQYQHQHHSQHVHAHAHAHDLSLVRIESRRGPVLPPQRAAFGVEIGAGHYDYAADLGVGERQARYELPYSQRGGDRAYGAPEADVQREGERDAEDDDDEDIERNPLYQALMALSDEDGDARSEHAHAHARAHSAAGGSLLSRAHLVVLPCLAALQCGDGVGVDDRDHGSAGAALARALRSGAYARMHALAPSRLFKDTFVPVHHAAAGEAARGARATGRESPGDEGEDEDGERERGYGAQAHAHSTPIRGGVHAAASPSAGTDAQEEQEPWAAMRLRVSAGAERGTLLVRVRHAHGAHTNDSFTRRVLSEVTVYVPALAPDGSERDVRVRVLTVDGLLVPIVPPPPALPEAEGGAGAAHADESTATSASSCIAFPVSAAAGGGGGTPELSLSSSSARADDDGPAPHWSSPPHRGSLAMSRSPGSASSHGHFAPGMGGTMLSRSASGMSHASSLGAAEDDPLLAAIPAARHVAADLALALDADSALPLGGHGLAAPLQAAFASMQSTTAQFNSSFVYVPGFEEYNAARIRKGIFLRAWRAFEQARNSADTGAGACPLPHRAKTRVMCLLENLAMALCHDKVYASLRKTKRADEAALEEILQRYREYRLSLDDFGVAHDALKARPDLLDAAVETLNAVPSGETTYPDVVRAMHDDPPARLRTPLDCLHIFKAAIEAIRDAAAAAVAYQLSRRGSSQALSPRSAAAHAQPYLSVDELLPLLAYVIVKSHVNELVTLLAHVQLFRMSEDDGPSLRWVSTTLAAVVEYLRTDPLSGVLFEKPRALASPVSRSSSVRSARPTSPGSALSGDGSGFSNTSHGFGARRSPKPSFNSDERRRSLPLSAAYGRISLEEALKAREENRPSSPTSSQDHTDKDGFKVPSLPASASMSSELPLRGGSAKKSGNSDLQIRPQLIVRHRRRHLLSTGSASSGSEHAGSLGKEGTYRTRSPHTRDITTSSYDARRRSIDALGSIGSAEDFFETGTSSFVRSDSGSSISFTHPSMGSPVSSSFSARPGSIRSVSSGPDDRQSEAGGSLGKGARRRKNSHALLAGSQGTRSAPADAVLASVQAQTLPADSGDRAGAILAKSIIPAPVFLHRVHVPTPVSERSDPFNVSRPHSRASETSSPHISA